MAQHHQQPHHGSKNPTQTTMRFTKKNDVRREQKKSDSGIHKTSDKQINDSAPYREASAQDEDKNARKSRDVETYERENQRRQPNEK